MDWNEHWLEWLARERVAEARAAAARWALLRSLPPAPSPLRVALGRALIRLGQWLAAAPAAADRLRRAPVR